MIESLTESVLRFLLKKHQSRFPKDERFDIRFVEPAHALYADGVVGIHVSRVKGIGLNCEYRHAKTDVELRSLRYDRGALLTALAEAIDNLVRIILRPLRPTFRIRRDGRRLSHRADPPTRRFASRLSRQA